MKKPKKRRVCGCFFSRGAWLSLACLSLVDMRGREGGAQAHPAFEITSNLAARINLVTLARRKCRF